MGNIANAVFIIIPDDDGKPNNGGYVLCPAIVSKSAKRKPVYTTVPMHSGFSHLQGAQTSASQRRQAVSSYLLGACSFPL
jgi:hypothetical protein